MYKLYSSGFYSGLLLFMFCFQGFMIRGQNLVKNCDLEVILGCPSNHGQITLCEHWSSPGQGTSDFVHACNSGNYSVPSNQWGYQDAYSGNGMMHLILYYSTNGQYREYMQGKLACELQAGETYVVSFFVSCADDSRFALDGIGAYFSVDPLQQGGPIQDEVIPLPGEVHVRNPIGHVVDNKDDWVEIHGNYVAQGGERYITIGNFMYDDELTLETFSSYDASIGSYYFDMISVEPLVPMIDLGPDRTICPYDSITFDFSDICPNANLIWEDNSVSLFRTISEAGTYSISGIIGCTDFYDEVTIYHHPDPGQFLPADTVICPGKIVEIIPNTGFNSYEWQDGSTFSVYDADTSGTYWMTGWDVHGCSFTDTVVIESLENPSFYLGPDTIFCQGQEITLDAGVDSAFHQFLWSDYSNGLTLTVSDSGLYWLKVTNPCGELTDSIIIQTYNCNTAIEAPNAFTPNADGLNDTFKIKAENIRNFNMYVFDRWGSLIFESSNLDNGWDGNIKGSPAPAGTYAWVAIYDTDGLESEGERKKIRGTVVLLK